MPVSKIDLHCDISFCALNGKVDLFKPIENVFTERFWDDEEIIHQISIPDALDTNTVALFGVIFPYTQNMDISRKDDLIKSYKEQSSYYDNLIEDLKNKNINIKIIKHIESLYFLDENNYLSFLQEFKRNNIKSIGIMWNKDSNLGCGNATETDTGLTDLGRKVIKKMVEMGFIIDLAHTSYKTFFDILEIVPDNHPLMCSHANVYSINPHHRNLKDDQIQALIDRDAVFGLSFVKGFVGGQTIDDWYRHFDYVVSKFDGGENIVALGSDFDGMFKSSLMHGLEKISDLVRLESYLLDRTERDMVDKFFWHNADKILKF